VLSKAYSPKVAFKKRKASPKETTQQQRRFRWVTLTLTHRRQNRGFESFISQLARSLAA